MPYAYVNGKPMREICLDTETTGLKPEEGHRIIEIGAVELLDKAPTGREFHVYINPQRDVPQEAVNVHGLTAEFLADKPLFADVAQDFLDFIGDATLVIHNAEFDRRFLNHELGLLNLPRIPRERCVDTLAIARAKFPGAPASLDALCKRFGVDNSHRDLHGALLDARILAEVYLELAGGRQRSLTLSEEPTISSVETSAAAGVANSAAGGTCPPRPAPLPSRLDQEDLTRHAQFINDMAEKPLWWKWLK